MEKVFSFFSNTVEEFEPFVKAGTFYWPRSIAKKTKYQRDNNIDTVEENVGDTVYIVAGANVKNKIKDSVLKDKITGFPMITHRGTVKEVFGHPVMGYRYTHGRNPDNSFMLPFEFLEELIQLDVYLGKPFSKENKEELKQAIELGKIIKALLKTDKIHFKRAYFKDGFIFIQNDDTESLFQLDNELSEITYEEAVVSDRLTYREMPSKQSLLEIVQECNAVGLDGHSLIQNLRTWRGQEFVKVEIEEEVFKKVEGKLQEGVSTRLIVKEDNSDSLITDIKRKVNIGPIHCIHTEGDVHMQFPKNQILYGPPGTGKTYSVVRKALEIVDPILFEELDSRNADRSEWMEAYKKYTDNKQIQFCTFHQSYSYEDFVEGLRSDKDGKFVPMNGIFLDICEEVIESNQIITPTYEFDEEQTNFYKMSLGRKGIDDDILQYCLENNVITIGFGSEINFSECKTPEEIKVIVEENYTGTDKKETVTQAVSYFKCYLSENDIVLISNGNSEIRAIGRVTGGYYHDEETEIRFNHFRKVEWLYTDRLIPVEEILIGRKFMMRSIYSLDKNNLNLDAFQKIISIVENVEVTESKNFVLIMDEINRGNISRIFGELITLIEDDKRLGEQNEVVVKLPYSRKIFGVPANLYLIGTMNTADRSIELMDTALRRRFEFIEMFPDISLLPKDIDGVNVQKLVDTINQRIEYLYDRDHTIGHAFFLSDHLSKQNLINIMQKKVIPLLQEYFYDDWEKIELVLGGAANGKDSNYFIQKEMIQPANIFRDLRNNRLQEQVKYSIVSNPTKVALLNIYESESNG